jgi:rsbT antagonist protein RsbS
MPGTDHSPPEPLRVSILAQGRYLIASIHTALDDNQFKRFQADLIDRIGRKRARGVIIDVAALDVLDSFGSRTLRDLAEVARLRGAETVIVGIQPEVAFAMVQFGIGLDPMHTALDLEEGLARLEELVGARGLIIGDRT